MIVAAERSTTSRLRRPLAPAARSDRSASAVDIIITDVKRENWATGGELWADKK